MAWDGFAAGMRAEEENTRRANLSQLQSMAQMQGINKNSMEMEQQNILKGILSSNLPDTEKLSALASGKAGILGINAAMHLSELGNAQAKSAEARKLAAFRSPANLAQFSTGGTPAQPAEVLDEGVSGPPRPAQPAVPGQIDPRRMLAGAAAAGIIDPLAYAKEQIAENKPQFAPSRSPGYFQGGQYIPTPESNVAKELPFEQAMRSRDALAAKNPNDPRIKFYNDFLTHATNPASQREIVNPMGAAPTAKDAPPKSAAEQMSLDMQAWNYLTKRMLPYKKGTGGGKDANDAVLKQAGEIGATLKMSAEEIATLPEQKQSDARSLYAQTKKVDAVQGVMNSFHNNMDTWESFAQGLMPKIGGAGVAAIAGDLKKINFIGVRSLDEIKLKIEKQFNDPTVSAYMIASMAVAMDYGRIMAGGSQSAAMTPEGARIEAVRLMSAGANDAGRRGIRAALESDAQGQIKGQIDQMNLTRDRLTGKARATAVPSSSVTDQQGSKNDPTYSDAEKERRYQSWKKANP